MAVNTSQGHPPPSQKVSDVIATFQPVRRFAPDASHAPYHITSLDFDDTGEFAIVSRTDETLQIYNCKAGAHAKELKSQKYGVDLARFTHNSQSIIYASSKGDDHALRYLSTHDNSYIRYFKGHTAPVTCLTLSPSSDQFLSSGLDNTVRLWSLKSSSPQGQLNFNSPFLCAYDPSATVIAVASSSAQSVLLYDLRNYDKAPFATFDLKPAEDAFAQHNKGRSTPGVGRPVPEAWTKLEFSNDGKRLLLATNGAGHYILDAFEGDLQSYCARPQGATNRLAPFDLQKLHSRGQSRNSSGPGSQGDACFSPDGRYLISGSGDKGLYVWDLQDGDVGPDKMLRPGLELPNKGTAAVVGYNPRHNLLVSADRDVIFWLPDTDA